MQTPRTRSPATFRPARAGIDVYTRETSCRNQTSSHWICLLIPVRLTDINVREECIGVYGSLRDAYGEERPADHRRPLTERVRYDEIFGRSATDDFISGTRSSQLAQLRHGVLG